ncbi:MAG: L,D-transpeptidase family protein [Acidimicrobiales bacterium]
MALAVAGALVVVGAGASAIFWVSGSGPHEPTAAESPHRSASAFTVVSTTPDGGSKPVAPATPITVSFSAPVAKDSTMPSLSPPVSGTWSLMSPSELEFVPSAPLVPGANESVVIPGGSSGMTSTQGVHLVDSASVAFSVETGSVLRLQQLLAELGYLPLSFTPTSPITSVVQEADIQPGTFSWRWPDQPSSLTSLWATGQMNVITRGAVMDFESQHGLKTDGIAGPAVWTALLTDALSAHTSANHYHYVYVSEADPEMVTVYQDGSQVYRTLANTGVPAAPTDQGTFPVFARYVSTTMTGTNPDGSKYDDPGVPWVSYFNGGDALHGFIRGGYGYPQSDGCVEMAPGDAAVVYPLTPIGTLVTVGN